VACININALSCRSGLTGRGDGFDKEDAGRQRKSRAAADAVNVILSYADNAEAKAEEIVEPILNHRKLKVALTRETQESQSEREAKDLVFEELVSSLVLLSRSGNGSVKWHAYQTVLNAIIPAGCPHPAVLARLLKGSAGYRTVKKALITAISRSLSPHTGR
jgi:hypothetical protein